MSRSGFTVGCSVVLSHDYRDHGDASDGPLKPGDVGTLIQDDGSFKPFLVEYNGRKHWYVEDALELAGKLRVAGGAPGSGTSSSSSGPSHPTLSVGDRVRRGEDWKWGSQDNHGAGTVVEELDSNGWVAVKWDDGSRDK